MIEMRNMLHLDLEHGLLLRSRALECSVVLEIATNVVIQPPQVPLINVGLLSFQNRFCRNTQFPITPCGAGAHRDWCVNVAANQALCCPLGGAVPALARICWVRLKLKRRFVDET